jgi:hypothetical protein
MLQGTGTAGRSLKRRPWLRMGCCANHDDDDDDDLTCSRKLLKCVFFAAVRMLRIGRIAQFFIALFFCLVLRVIPVFFCLHGRDAEC